MTLREFQKTVAMTLLAKRPSLIFFGAYSPIETHCFDCYFGLWCGVVDSSSTIKKEPKDLEFKMNNTKQFKTVTWLCLWSIVSNRGTH